MAEELQSLSETASEKEPIGSFGKTEAPPAYADLFPNMKNVKSRIEKAREKDGPVPRSVAVSLTVCDIICKSFFCGCCYLVLAAFPIAMIAIGSIYLHDCTIQDKIPIFLIVFGCVSLLQTCCGMSKMISCQRNNDDENDNRKLRRKGSVYCCEGCVMLFLFISVIIISIFTFSAWDDWVDHGRQSCPAGGDYCCAPALMYFTFSTLLMIYGVAVVAIFCLCCFLCCLVIYMTAGVIAVRGLTGQS